MGMNRKIRKLGLLGKLGLVALMGVMLASFVLVGRGGQSQPTPPPAAPAQIMEKVTPSEARDMIETNRDNPNFVLLDVRTPEEYAESHIENSALIDYQSQSFISQMDGLDRGLTYLIYCRTGNRSGKAQDVMRQLGFREVHDMTGGIVQWTEEQFPTVQ